jgi:hypothetical protein
VENHPRGGILTNTWVDLKEIGKLDAGRSREIRGVASNRHKNCANYRYGITDQRLFYTHLTAIPFTKYFWF